MYLSYPTALQSPAGGREKNVQGGCGSYFEQARAKKQIRRAGCVSAADAPIGHRESHLDLPRPPNLPRPGLYRCSRDRLKPRLPPGPKRRISCHRLRGGRSPAGAFGRCACFFCRRRCRRRRRRRCCCCFGGCSRWRQRGLLAKANLTPNGALVLSLITSPNQCCCSPSVCPLESTSCPLCFSCFVAWRVVRCRRRENYNVFHRNLPGAWSPRVRGSGTGPALTNVATSVDGDANSAQSLRAFSKAWGVRQYGRIYSISREHRSDSRSLYYCTSGGDGGLALRLYDFRSDSRRSDSGSD